MHLPITEHVHKSARHCCFYLACGPQDGPLVIFLHGWPELSISWRHQLTALASLGFRAVAPDMRGYGRSTVHPRQDDYTVEQSVADMLELLQSLGRERAVWVGHDWGTPVAWSIASHHPQVCQAVAGLCVPYLPDGFAVQTLMPLVDRQRYPADRYPAGQWDYQLYYEEHFEAASALFDRDPARTMRMMFRRGNPADRDKPSMLASIRAAGGWFGGSQVPDLPRDPAVLDEPTLAQYTAAVARNGFFGPDAWYVNGPANMAFARQAHDGGRLAMPVLFLHAEYDYVCQTLDSRLADPMRAMCADLTEARVPSGHWMAQEKPLQVNAALVRWLVARVPQALPFN